MARVRRRKHLIPGPVLVGFGELFERSFGREDSPRTADGGYVRVTPTVVGGVLLPFPCVHCGAVQPAVVDSKKRYHYYDRDRRFSWCPACQKRYVINPKGSPLKGSLPAGATHAPALVERDGKTSVIGLLAADGLVELGAA